MGLAKSTTPPAAPRRTAGSRYLEFFRADPLERINRIKRGVSAADAKLILAHLHLPQGETLKALKLSQATVNKKAKQDQMLAPDEGERVLGMAKLVGQLEAMVEESGDPVGFDAAGWLSQWLREPIPALGGARPFDLMDTMEGQTLVSRTLAQAQSGAYA